MRVAGAGLVGKAVGLTPAQFGQCFVDLPPAARDELYRFAAYIASRYLGNAAEAGDLVQHVLEATLAGRRICPDNIDLLVYLKQTTKWVALNARKKLNHEGRAYSQMATLNDRGFGDIEPGPNPGAVKEQEEIIRRARIGRIMSLFKDDPKARLYMTLRLQGRRGADLRREMNLDGKALDSLRRKVQRRLDRLVIEKAGSGS
jgi:hypothetical protein